MKCLFIYNPASGKSKKVLENMDYIEKSLRKVYEKVDIVSTNGPKDATKLAKEACGVYDVLVFSGGDGTFNEVVQGVSNMENRPVLSYIPAGTVCDMAKNLAIPLNLKGALRIATKGSRKKSDVCKINDDYFIYVAGIGVYTGVTYESKKEAKQKFGKIAYFIEGFKKSFNTEKIKVRIKIEEKVYEEEVILLLVANSKSVAGFTINKKGNLNDGKVDIILVKQNIFKIPFNVWKLFLYGLKIMRKKKCIRHFNTDKVEIEVLDDAVWTVDGEEYRRNDVKIEVLRRHLTFLVDKRKARKLY